MKGKEETMRKTGTEHMTETATTQTTIALVPEIEKEGQGTLQEEIGIRVTKTFAKGITGYHVLNGEEMSAHYNQIKKITVNQFEEEMPKKWHEDIKRHILSIERTKKTRKLDYIFEEDEQDD